MAKLKIDKFLLAIITAAIIATIFPAQGPAITVVEWATKIAVAVLFFLYGARLEPREAFEALKHWRLHLTILAFTFVLFPLLGLGLRVTVPVILPEPLYLGMLYLTLVPSTVQSSINFTSIAKGNVAGAIVSASFSNLLGVVLTPLLVVGLMATTSGVKINAGSIIDICGQLLLPFAIGQLSRRWTADWVQRQKKPLKFVDQGVIVLVVYAAFSAGMREGIWSMVSVLDIVKLLVVSAVVLAFTLWSTRWVADRLGFNREDAIAIQFCGTKKSLATGLPMATVLFAGQPIGLLVLPLMVFHQIQLMACAVIAERYGREIPD